MFLHRFHLNLRCKEVRRDPVGGRRRRAARIRPGQPGGARSDRLLYQAKLALDDDLRIKVVRAMYRFRFQEEPPARRSIDQLRGIEGVRVRTMYQLLAQAIWRSLGKSEVRSQQIRPGDVVNRCLSVANHCLYGLCEAAILAAGYAPAIGFLHTGKPLSFVYDIADLFKFETAVPIAFKVVAANKGDPRAGNAAILPQQFPQAQAAGPDHSHHRGDSGGGGDSPAEGPRGSHAHCHSQRGANRRCWSSCLKTPRPGCAAT